jgi:phosphoenolpyruvate carboxykinase (ATP)
VPTSVRGVEPDLLNPIKTWKDKAEFDATARKLVRMFQENFRAFEGSVDNDVIAAASDVHVAAE